MSLTIINNYNSVKHPGYRDPPISLSIYVAFSFDPGWSFYQFNVADPFNYPAGHLSTNSFPYPPSQPGNPLFEVVVTPFSNEALYNGSVTLSGKNNDTGEVRTVSANYAVNVTGAVTPVPEPASSWLLLLGTLGLVGRLIGRKT